MSLDTCRLDNYSGGVSLDDGEVAETRWMQLAELRQHAEQHPEAYTQWFLDEVRSLAWFQCKRRQQEKEVEDGSPVQGGHAAPVTGQQQQQQLAGAAN